MTARGLLRWRITLRRRAAAGRGGAVPLLIEWGGVHPTDSLPASGVTLERIEIGGVRRTAMLFAPQRRRRLGRGRGRRLLGAVLSPPRGRVDLARAGCRA